MTALLLWLPLALVSLIFVIVGIPSSSRQTRSQGTTQAFTEIMSNRSALARLIANILAVMTQNAVLVTFASSMFRQKYAMDSSIASLVFAGIAVASAIANLIDGRIVQRYGRKRLTVISSCLLGICSIIMNMPVVWVALIVWVFAGFMLGLKNLSYNTLALEQVPEYRGTMMSLSDTSRWIGQAIGNGLGGLILVAFGYEVLGFMAVTAVVASLIFHIFTIDPTQRKPDVFVDT